MSKAVLISIQPKWCEKIANGEKTVEVRKSRPKLEAPFKCYIYCTYGQGLIQYNDTCYPNMLLDQKVDKDNLWGNCCNGKVIGEFVCDKFFPYCNARPIGTLRETPEDVEQETCLSRKEIWAYEPNGNPVGWHISDLLIYDTPKLLSEFGMKRPPQSWRYVEEVERVYSERNFD